MAKIVLSLKELKPGDELLIEPIPTLPNFDRRIKVDYVRGDVIHYGASETSDGHTYPYWAIASIKKLN